MSELIQTIWISESVRSLSHEELVQLLRRSRANNTHRNVTGLLLHDHRSFMQFMEGEASVVDDIFKNRIQPSHLHKNVLVLSRREIEARNFEDWEMGFFHGDHKSLDSIPGYCDFNRTKISFMDLDGDPALANKIINGFHHGLWHQAKPKLQPCPLRE